MVLTKQNKKLYVPNTTLYLNTQLPPADDGEWFLWKFWNPKMWELKISFKYLFLSDKNRKPCFMDLTDPFFPISEIFFFNLPKFGKIGHFLTKILKFYLKNVENKSEYFLRKFLQKTSGFFFFENSVFLR